MIHKVSDSAANKHDQIFNAAELLKGAPQRIKVFEAIYNGKQRIKDKSEISTITNLSEKRVIEEGKKLANDNIVIQTKKNNKTAYCKIDFYGQHKRKILSLAKNPKKYKSYPTKINPDISKNEQRIILTVANKGIKVKMITIDDLDDFKLVKKVKSSLINIPIDEKQFKESIKKIIGEEGKFTDWGGEKNDLYTTRVKLNGKRTTVAFAFKGKGKKGILKPSMMGKNGDQILRLFQSEAELYVLQYWDQIDQSVYETMNQFATAKSALTNSEIKYCIIDGKDTARIIKAYS